MMMRARVVTMPTLSVLVVVVLALVVVSDPLSDGSESGEQASSKISQGGCIRRSLATGLLLGAMLFGGGVEARRAVASLSSRVLSDDSCTPLEPNSQQRYVSGYFPSSAISDRNFTPFDVAVEELTHFTYAFAQIQDGEIANGDKETDLDRDIPNPDPSSGPLVFKGAFDAMNNPLSPFRRRNPSIRTLISIGGWGGSKEFSDVALSDRSREKFALSVARFIAKFGFDGVDIDWEYPTGGGAAGNVEHSGDVAHFTKLLVALRKALTGQCLFGIPPRAFPYLLTAATSAGQQGYGPLELPQIIRSVDWLNVMTYDYAAPGWSPGLAYNSPLDMINNTIKGYLAAGVPTNRILVGVPFYGHLFGGATDPRVGSPFNKSLTPGDGTVEYDDVAANYTSEQGYTAFWDPVSKVPYLWNEDKQIWVSTENPASVVYKARFVNDNNLQGVAIWEVSHDDNLLLKPLSDTIKCEEKSCSSN